MRYKYIIHLNDLKDLKHIEWFVLHSDQYEFQNEEAKNLIGRLKNNIQKKNTLYSEIVTDYEELVRHFDNDPYHYWFELSGENPNVWMTSNITENYFIVVKDEDGWEYTVPYKYIKNNTANHAEGVLYKNSLQGMFTESQNRAIDIFQSIQNIYTGYWVEGGVMEALNRYKKIHNGDDYNIPLKLIMLFFYNILLGITVHETCFCQVITHFWQLYSKKQDAVYSIYSIFPDHPYLGTISLVAVGIFVYLDIVYCYGIYYMMFMKKKYDMVKNHHDKMITLLDHFQEDFEACRKGLPDVIPKVRNRKNIYEPLIRKSRARYNFFIMKKKKNEDGQVQNIRIIQPFEVPVKNFYLYPMFQRLIWLLVAIIFIRAICNVYNIMIY